jgi:hypothetical protein
VTYAADAQPIFQAKCSPCHTVGDSAGVNFASSYADTQVAGSPAYCPSGITVGACTLVRIQNGSMPFGAGCTGDPAQDVGNSACVTAAQQATLQSWISDGQQP